MGKSLFIRTSITFLLLLISFSSCIRHMPRGKNIICVVDFSDSKNATERLQFYLQVINENIIPKLGYNDKISIIPIDMASVTNSSDLLLQDMSEIDFEPEFVSPLEVEKLTNDNFVKFKDSLASSFASSFQKAILNRNNMNQGTDIFGVLDVVKGRIKPSDDNYLIFLSDMMNWSNVLIMEPSNKAFNYSTLEESLKKVPNIVITNTKVLVITGEQVEASAEHYKLVRTFWIKYFETNKINLFDYNSASVSKLNELMALPATKDE